MHALIVLSLGFCLFVCVVYYRHANGKEAPSTYLVARNTGVPALRVLRGRRTARKARVTAEGAERSSAPQHAAQAILLGCRGSCGSLQGAGADQA